ncbi:uncharacterized protein LOC128955748 [Oppia nitens]|uniref:uncharacterized protein LOC128955748 n=1 Tax=Oppia nitens TaxID=1686743 RepID=UPI0023DA5C91|nr:uncharacterized protein LOC128955748 [Oppia nitens]
MTYLREQMFAINFLAIIVSATNYNYYNGYYGSYETSTRRPPPIRRTTTTKRTAKTTTKPYRYTRPPPTSGPGGQTTSHPAPEPYKFEYDINVGSPDPTGHISQSESGDANGVVTGMYSLRDPDGRQRTVIYKADSNGFRATIETNELPPDVPNPADVTIIGTGVANSDNSESNDSS